MKKRKEEFDQIKYQNEYNRANYDTILLTLPKGMKEKVKKRASSLGKSMNGYINSIIIKDIAE